MKNSEEADGGTSSSDCWDSSEHDSASEGGFSDEWELDFAENPLDPPKQKPPSHADEQELEQFRPVLSSGSNGANDDIVLPTSANIAVEAESVLGKRKRSKRPSESVIRRRQHVQKSQLVTGIARLIHENEACNSPRLRAAVLSCLPTDILQSWYGMGGRVTLKKCQELLDWFVFSFASTQLSRGRAPEVGMANRIDLTQDHALFLDSKADRETSDLEKNLVRSVSSCFKAKPGSKVGSITDNHLVCLFLALLRGLGVPSRLVHAPQPVLWRGPSSQRKRHSSNSRQRQTDSRKATSRKTKGATSKKSSNSMSLKSYSKNRKKGTRVATKWLELYIQGRWIAVDVIYGILDKPENVEQRRARKRPLVYAIAIEANGCMIDVMPRYCHRPATADKLRVPVVDQKYKYWVEAQISTLSKVISTQRCPQSDLNMRTFPNLPAQNTFTAETNVGDQRLQFEQAELQLLRKKEPLPTSEAAFINHPLFCLKKHLRRNQVIIGQRSCGMFKGQPVFSRTLVQEVFSAVQWKKKCRTIKEDQVDSPAKSIPKTNKTRNSWLDDDPLPFSSASSSSSSSSTSSSSSIISGRFLPNSDSEDEVELTHLYGRWQTEEWTPPPVVDGRLPRNEYGNWEVWTPAHIPRGAVHLQLLNIRKAAEHLGVDYVRAVCNFKSEKRRVVPSFSGILVAKETADAVIEAYEGLSALAHEKSMKETSRKACVNWARFVRKLFTKMYVARLFDESH